MIPFTVIQWGQHMICWTWKIKCCPRPRGNILSEGPIYHMLSKSPVNNIVLLYLHWFRIKFTIQTIHKQTDDDQTGPDFENWFGTNLALVWINSYTIKLSRHPGLRTLNWHNLGRFGFGQRGFRTNWHACDVKRVTAGQHWFLYCLRSKIDFYLPAALNINYRDYIERNLYEYNNIPYLHELEHVEDKKLK